VPRGEFSYGLPVLGVGDLCDCVGRPEFRDGKVFITWRKRSCGDEDLAKIRHCPVGSAVVQMPVRQGLVASAELGQEGGGC